VNRTSKEHEQAAVPGSVASVRRRRLCGASAVWILNVLLVGIWAVLHASAGRHLGPLDPSFHLPWYVLAVGFGLAEMHVVHLRFRSEAHSFSLNEIPLVLGLFFVSANGLVAAQLLGAAVALVFHRRQPAVKLAFNLAAFGLEATLAAVVFRSVVGHLDPLGPGGWAGAFLATVTSAAVAIVAIVLAILISERQIQLGRMVQSFGFGMAGTFTNTSFALVGVLIMWQHARAVWLLIVPGIVLSVAYRAYMSERAKRDGLEFLYTASKLLQGSDELDDAVVALLEHTRQMFHAEVAEITMFPSPDSEDGLRTTLGPGEHAVVMEPVAAGASRRILSMIGSDGDAVLLSSLPGAVKIADLDGADLKDAMVAALHGETRVVGTFMLGKAEGAVATFDEDELRLFETLANQVSVALENGRLEHSLAQLKSLEAELVRQAYHDPLTELANRALFRDRVKERLEQLQPGDPGIAVLFIDLDDFKTVNDSLGHAAGDQLLMAVGERIEQCVRAGDLAARLGGDEFAVLLEGIDDIQLAATMAQRILAAFRKPVGVDGANLSVQASIGVATSETAQDVDEFLRNADVAMYTAKRNGKGWFQLFEPLMGTEVVERHQLKADLERAIERGEFTVYYQPFVDLKDGRIVSVEALVRWEHPTRGLLLPADFIPLAEETGLIVAIGREVLREACRQASLWRTVHPDLAMSVNLSPRQIEHRALVDDVRVALEDAALEPEALILEITESIMVQDLELTVDTLTALKGVGVLLAIDDFGTGYSSLSYLRRLPVDILKIAKPFVDGLGTTPEELAFVHANVKMGQTLHLELVAEGVEREEQFLQLSDLDCDFGQGFYFAKPMPADDMLRLLGPAVGQFDAAS
jgi:diguanylate cyclase (GGDEF)-like protein